MVLKTLRTCLSALLAGWLSVGLIASANEPESAKEPGTKQEQATGASGEQSDRNAASSPPASTPRRATPDFSPTEEISEDIAIPFPVDI
jgi:hypothetical protein